ncbi:unannotated protein [freshwater metagenome]|uniref:Unannotated protein n=1 Tax=freshwater metagenome TaxID=449393 RepID=A0A6J7GLR6_9ZZZZ
MKVVVTKVLPPKIGVVAATESPVASMSTLLVSTVRPSLTDKRAITSRPSYDCGNMMRSGDSPPSIVAFIADATETPAKF